MIQDKAYNMIHAALNKNHNQNENDNNLPPLNNIVPQPPNLNAEAY